MNRSLIRVFTLAVFGTLAMSNYGRADSYTIDPTQSYINVELWLGGSPISVEPPNGGSQPPFNPPGVVIAEDESGGSSFGAQFTQAQDNGSDTSALFGTLNATVAGGNISFGGGSSISLTNFPTNLLPDADGGDATGPDPAATSGTTWQIGLGLNASFFGAGLAYFGIGGATLDVTGGPTAIGGSSFDATAQTLSLLSGNLASFVEVPGIGTLNGPQALATPNATAQNGVDAYGYSTYNTGSAVGSSLFLPLFADFQENVLGISLDLIFTGQIVATDSTPTPQVPEPSTLVLAGIGLVIGSAVAVRRKLAMNRWAVLVFPRGS